MNAHNNQQQQHHQQHLHQLQVPVELENEMRSLPRLETRPIDAIPPRCTINNINKNNINNNNNIIIITIIIIISNNNNNNNSKSSNTYNSNNNNKNRWMVVDVSDSG